MPENLFVASESGLSVANFVETDFPAVKKRSSGPLLIA